MGSTRRDSGRRGAESWRAGELESWRAGELESWRAGESNHWQSCTDQCFLVLHTLSRTLNQEFGNRVCSQRVQAGREQESRRAAAAMAPGDRALLAVLLLTLLHGALA